MRKVVSVYTRSDPDKRFDTWLSPEVELDQFTTFAYQGIDSLPSGYPIERYTCSALTASGRTVPFGSLRWFEDEACLCFCFCGNPRLGLVAFDFAELLPTKEGRERVSEGLKGVLAGKMVMNWNLGGNTAVEYAKHPLFLMFVNKFSDPSGKKDLGADFDRYMKMLVEQESSIVYQFAKGKWEINLSDTQGNSFVTSTFALSKESKIISGKEMHDSIEEAYDKTSKNVRKLTPGTNTGRGYDVASILIATSAQYNASYHESFPQVATEPDFYRRVVTDIMDGDPDFVSVVDPTTLEGMYEGKVKEAELWSMHTAIMNDIYNNLFSISSGSVQVLMKGATLRGMTSGQLDALIGRVAKESDKMPNVEESRNIKYLDVIIRIMLVKAAKL